jgi:cytochrome c oxidase cbb3-type subunit 2
MPPYPWLFEEEEEYSEQVFKAQGKRIVPVPVEYRPNGKVIIATDDALDLVAYLLSLNHTYSITEKE